MTSIILLFAGAVGICCASHTYCEVECSREEKIMNYGLDIAKRPLFIDIGECRTVNISNISVCTADQQQDYSVCIKQCSPRSQDLQLRSNRDGPLMVPTIRSCYPTRDHCLKQCERRPSIYYLFPDSKYQTRIDVGKCVGECNESDNNCVPIKRTTVSVRGANGPVVMEMILECQCRFPECYKEDYFESYWEYKRCDNSTIQLEKIINVGRCVGECRGVQLPARCFPSEDNCLLPIPSGPAKCVPTTSVIETFTDVNFNTISIPAIDECGCASG